MGIVSLVALRAEPLGCGEAVWRGQPGALARAAARIQGIFRTEVGDRDDDSDPSSAAPLHRVGDARELQRRDDVLTIMRSPAVARWWMAGDTRTGGGRPAVAGRASA